MLMLYSLFKMLLMWRWLNIHMLV